MNTLFHSYWSGLPEYEALAHKCAESFARFGVTVNVKEIQSHNDWMKNCMARSAVFHSDILENAGKTNVLLDADLECVADPVLLKTFDTIDGDVAIHDRAKFSKNTRYCAGILAVAPTINGRECIRRWALNCKEDKEPAEYLREQVYLYMAIESMKQNECKFSLKNIGWAYNSVHKIFGISPVIKHYAASLKLLKKIGGSR